MKKRVSFNTVLMSIILFMSFCPLHIYAQRSPGNVAPWVSGRGFWILEHNIKTPRNTTVYFYNNEKTLVYKEKIEGIKLNVKKKRVLMRLKSVLEQSVNAWAVQHVTAENQFLLANALGIR